jgi:hypothetical protein
MTLVWDLCVLTENFSETYQRPQIVYMKSHRRRLYKPAWTLIFWGCITDGCESAAAIEVKAIIPSEHISRILMSASVKFHIIQSSLYPLGLYRSNGCPPTASGGLTKSESDLAKRQNRLPVPALNSDVMKISYPVASSLLRFVLANSIDGSSSSATL